MVSNEETNRRAAALLSNLFREVSITADEPQTSSRASSTTNNMHGSVEAGPSSAPTTGKGKDTSTADSIATEFDVATIDVATFERDIEVEIHRLQEEQRNPTAEGKAAAYRQWVTGLARERLDQQNRRQSSLRRVRGSSGDSNHEEVTEDDQAETQRLRSFNNGSGSRDEARSGTGLWRSPATGSDGRRYPRRRYGTQGDRNALGRYVGWGGRNEWRTVAGSEAAATNLGARISRRLIEGMTGAAMMSRKRALRLDRVVDVKGIGHCGIELWRSNAEETVEEPAVRACCEALM